MNLITWKRSPGTLRRGVDELMDRFFTDPWSAFGSSAAPLDDASAFAPTVDVADGDKEVTVRAELPGLKPEDISITVEKGVLTLSGEKKFEHEEEKKGWYRRECTYGQFHRTLALPQGVDSEKVSADYTQGVLTIRLAKSAEAAPRKIAVRGK